MADSHSFSSVELTGVELPVSYVGSILNSRTFQVDSRQGEGFMKIDMPLFLQPRCVQRVFPAWPNHQNLGDNVSGGNRLIRANLIPAAERTNNCTFVPSQIDQLRFGRYHGKPD